MDKTHELKTVPPYFEEVWDGWKFFELRKNDRDFKIYDYLHLREYIPSGGYTGRTITAIVNYILEGFAGLETGYCVMGIRVISRNYDKSIAERDNAAALAAQP